MFRIFVPSCFSIIVPHVAMLSHVCSIIFPSLVHHFPTICPASFHHFSTICPAFLHHVSIIVQSFFHHFSIIVQSFFQANLPIFGIIPCRRLKASICGAPKVLITASFVTKWQERVAAVEHGGTRHQLGRYRTLMMVNVDEWWNNDTEFSWNPTLVG